MKHLFFKLFLLDLLLTCKIISLSFSAPAAADLALIGRLQAEGRPLHRPQRSGQQHLADQAGHQRELHG